MEPSRDQRSSPSPCNYNVPTTLFKTSKITMKGRHPLAGDTSDVPGPGMYKIPSSCDRSSIIRLKGRTEIANPLTLNPGPGAYKIDKFQSTGKDISMGFRTQTDKFNDNPSPCHYNIDNAALYSPAKITLKSRNKDLTQKSCTEFTYSPQRAKTDLGQITLKSRHPVMGQNTVDTPAPCDYGTASPNHYKTSITLKSRREEIVDRSHLGPGQYSPNYNYGKKQCCSPDIKFKGNSKIIDPQKKQINDVYYNIPDTIHTSKNIMIKGRTEPSYDNKVPGPGSYNANYNSARSPTIGIKMGARTEKPGTLDYNLKSNDSPGPIYNVPKVYSPVKDITLKSRHPEYMDTDIPGPGSYDVREQFKKNTSKDLSITLKSRLPPIQAKQDDVGPATYDLNQGSYKRAEKKGISFGGRTFGQVQGYRG